MHTTASPEWDATGVATYIKALKAFGYTVSDLAERAGVHRSQISRWSSGAHRPGFDPLKRMSQAIMHENGQDLWSTVDMLCKAAGYPGISVDAGATQQPRQPAHQQVVSPYSGQVWRIVRSLKKRAEDAGLTESEERAVIERAMENAEKQAEMMFDAELARRHRGSNE